MVGEHTVPNPYLPLYDLCPDPLVLARQVKCSSVNSSPKTSSSKLESYLLSGEEDVFPSIHSKTLQPDSLKQLAKFSIYIN